MKTKHNLMFSALRFAGAIVALSGIVEAQIYAGDGIDLFNYGYIYNAPAIEGGVLDALQDAAACMVPISQFTGIKGDGSLIGYYDLLPLKTSSIEIVTGEGAAPPTGTGTIIDGTGIETNGLSILDSATSSLVKVTVENGTLSFKGPSGSLAPVALGALTVAGSIASAGSPVLTQASAISSGFVNDSNFSTKLAAITPPVSPAWTSTYLLRGNVTPLAGQTIGGYVAIGRSTASGPHSTAAGEGVTASGSYSSASGAGTTTASGVYARASGYNSLASGTYSTANGNSATAAGFFSFSNGFGTSAKSSNEVAFGRYNLESAPLAGTLGVNGLDGLFRLGNGTAAARSDAMTVLKSGETTLTNKDWKAAVVASPGNATIALANPPSTTDSNGNALVVDGHTVLNGKVIISVPQGDISMGIYQ
jgi:hypothetical protein